MTGRAMTATRASTRTKTAATVAQAFTKTTRTRTGAVTTMVPAPPLPPTGKKTAARKPLLNRDNAIDIPPPASKTKPKLAAVRKTGKQVNGSSETDHEAITAYLRIRPRVGEDEPMSIPYLIPLSDTSVRMIDPQDPQAHPTRFRPSTLPPSIYTFSHIFPPDTNQSDFFIKTTLPLVRDVLQGQNGLLFTYGVTNSGKTYTVQGGTKDGSAGILPRALDVIFNSIDGLQGDGRYRPVRLHGAEPAEPIDSKPLQITPEPALVEVLGQHMDISAPDADIDLTVLKVDRNYEYTIWLSYAEVYNEKVYDLLASVKDESNVNPDGSIPRSANGNSLLVTRKALPLRPSPSTDGSDSGMSGKYIAGLRQFRAQNGSQAKALVKLGQLHRRVFGTLANRESSRSHGMVIIKVVRSHRGEKDDPTSLQVSRLTLVDLAGSERTKHTHTTGERLKEAGNINKSLMVLGQCMEVMRTNQRKLAVSLSHEGIAKEIRMDTRDVKKGLSVVPFRHSKLTEALMDYFIGDGRVVMIVNVNPYDTGYDENSHVMKFAALAREVYVTPAPAPLHRVTESVVGPGHVRGNKIKELGPLTLKDPEIAPAPYRRKVTISVGGPGSGNKTKEAILEVLEEDEPNDGQNEDVDDDGPINPLVDALFDEVEMLRMRIFESEMRCAIIEAETREEVMHEMEARMRSMEEMYSRRLMNELEQNELKTDAKIDMLHQSGLFGSPAKKPRMRRIPSDLSEEEANVEMSLVDYGPDDQGTGSESASGEEFLFESEGETNSTRSRPISMSPLAGKCKTNCKSTPGKRLTIAPKEIREVRNFIPDPPMLPSDIEDAELTETEAGEDTESVAASGVTGSDDDIDEKEENSDYISDYNEDGDEEDDWAPPAGNNKTPKAKVPVHRVPSPFPEPRTRAPANKSRVSKLARDMDDMLLGSDDDSVVIIPVKINKPGHEPSKYDDDVDVDMEIATTKKKKRQLGKKPIMTIEQIEKATYAAERLVGGSGATNIRRLIRH